jgi:hypothetical protein
MSAVIWGLLEKGQTDPEKIEEAIARLILAHDNNPDAHLGATGSLLSHKAEEIIDHVAGSIIEDKIAIGAVTSPKITSNQIIGKDFRTAEDVGAEVDGVKFTPDGIEMWQGGIRKVFVPISAAAEFLGNVKVNLLTYLRHTWLSPFESLDSYYLYTESGTMTIELLRGAVELNTAINNLNKMMELSFLEPVFTMPDVKKNPCIQFGMKMSNATRANIWISWGYVYPLPDGWGPWFGFVVKSAQANKIYCSYNDNSVAHEFEISGIDLTIAHIFRAEIEDAGATLKFYIDGVLVHTANPTFEWDTTSTLWAVQIKAASNSPCLTYIFNFICQQDP